MAISEFSLEDKEIVIETRNGKVRLTFEEWKLVVDAYSSWLPEALKKGIIELVEAKKT